MAKSLLQIKTKKVVKVARSEQYRINVKYLGEEPVHTHHLSMSEYARALHWYNSMCTNGDARDYIKTYLTNVGRLDEAKMMSRVADVWLPTTAAWIARMISRGYRPSTDTRKFFEDSISTFLTRAIKEEPVDREPRPTVQTRVKEKSEDITADIEALIDSNEKFSLYEWLKAKEVPPTYSQNIVHYYVSWLAELLEALDGTDQQLKEAYRYMSKKQLRDRITFFNTMLEDAERYADTTKKVRAPRKPRPVSAEKKLKNLKYQKEDSTYKIASINPEKLLGAMELWTFNTKYKTLTVLRADSPSGLSVEGTSIVGYDEKTSSSKGTGRRPEYFIEKVRNTTKHALKKLMDEATASKPLAYRINENTILLRIV